LKTEIKNHSAKLERATRLELATFSLGSSTVGVSQLKAGAKMGMIRPDMWSAEAIL
jgi:hypothetical protein